jgi:hypothetical protein
VLDPQAVRRYPVKQLRGFLGRQSVVKTATVVRGGLIRDRARASFDLHELPGYIRTRLDHFETARRRFANRRRRLAKGEQHAANPPLSVRDRNAAEVEADLPRTPVALDRRVLLLQLGRFGPLERPPERWVAEFPELRPLLGGTQAGLAHETSPPAPVPFPPVMGNSAVPGPDSERCRIALRGFEERFCD